MTNKTPAFIEKFEVYGLYKQLTEIQAPSELQNLLSHTISKASEARKSLLGKAGGIIVVSGKDEGQNQDNDRKRRAQAAAERKAKVMAQMNQMQKKFADTHKSELAKMEVVQDTKVEQTSTPMAVRTSPRKKNFKGKMSI